MTAQLCLYTGAIIPDPAPASDILALLDKEAEYERSQGRHFAAMAIERVAEKIRKAVLG